MPNLVALFAILVELLVQRLEAVSHNVLPLDAILWTVPLAD